MKGNIHTPQGFVDHCFAMAQASDLRKRVDQLAERVKRLEEAGDGLLELVEAEACDFHLADQIQPRADEWRKAKEAKP